MPDNPRHGHVFQQFLVGHPRKITCDVSVGPPLPAPEWVQRASETPASVRLQQGVSAPASFGRNIGLFDTGATHTAVTSAVRRGAQLLLARTETVQTPAGNRECDVYYASLWLPNQILFPFLPVFEAECAGCDVLIGMDIIGQSNFTFLALALPEIVGGLFRFSPPADPQAVPPPPPPTVEPPP